MVQFVLVLTLAEHHEVYSCLDLCYGVTSTTHAHQYCKNTPAILFKRSPISSGFNLSAHDTYKVYGNDIFVFKKMVCSVKTLLLFNYKLFPSETVTSRRRNYGDSDGINDVTCMSLILPSEIRHPVSK